MSETSSLALLEGTGVKGPIESADDVNKASGEELEKFLVDQGVELPAEWINFILADKRKWILTQFDMSPSDVGQVEAVQEAAAEVKAETETSPIAHLPETVEAPVLDKKAKAAAKKAAKLAAGADAAKQDVALAPIVGEILESNAMSDMIHEIENLSEEAALDMALVLAEETETSWFKLGGVLHVIQGKKAYQQQKAHGKHEAYPNFQAYVTEGVGVNYPKAMVWVDIYKRLGGVGVPYSKIKSIQWTKLRHIAQLLNSDNIDSWVKIANSSTTPTVIELVKQEKLKLKGTLSIEENSAVTVVNKTFKMHEGQKQVIEAALEKAKALGETKFDTMALEYMASDFLAGDSTAKIVKPKNLTLEQHIDSALALGGNGEEGLEAVMNVLITKFPGYEFEVKPLPETIEAAAKAEETEGDAGE